MKFGDELTVYDFDCKLIDLNIGNIDTCSYWNNADVIDDATGVKNYSKLTYLARTVSHGNAVPERGFSGNNSFIT